MEKKNLIITSIIVVAVVIAGVSGGIWFFTQIGTTSDTSPPIQDLKIKYWDGTEKSINASTILDLIESGDLTQIKFKDSETTGQGCNITGVNIVELLNYLDFHAPWGVKVYNFSDNLNTDVGVMINSDGNMVQNPQTTNPLIIGIMANDVWLKNSPLGAAYGNFSLFGGDLNASTAIMNITSIEIMSEWVIPVYVNGILNYTIDTTTITTGDYDIYRWWYDDSDTDYFDWNSTHYGRTLYNIINQTEAKGVDYNLTCYAVDKFTYPKGGYNSTDVETGLTVHWNESLSTRYYINHSLDDNGNAIKQTGIPMPIDATHAPNGCLMWIADKEIDHTYEKFGDPSALKLIEGGPYKLIVPGQRKRGYIKWLVRIDIEIE